MYEVSVQATISASHHLRGYRGKCEQVHGHNWLIEATVGSETLDECGLSMDFGVLRQHLAEVLADFDHCDLNASRVFVDQNPSSENLARIVFERLRARLAQGGAEVVRVRVWEKEGSCASYFERRDRP
ncbi:MAG: 6-carboxytetrahydropterin synthase [Deltaproteobacteria bacterium]|nr:6-carboxytetrahydropterin synthase [Deltaproteobacteria bacterium]